MYFEFNMIGGRMHSLKHLHVCAGFEGEILYFRVVLIAYTRPLELSENGIQYTDYFYLRIGVSFPEKKIWLDWKLGQIPKLPSFPHS